MSTFNFTNFQLLTCRGPLAHLVERLICSDYDFKMFFLYILQSGLNGRFYTGSCKDVYKRLLLHNDGRVKSTKSYLPWKIVYTESFVKFTQARARELKIKSWKKRSQIEKLILHFKI